MMSNLSVDIQSSGFDTRPPMLDRSDFESSQQRIRLYCLGKENGENIHQSIDEGQFKMGKFRETLANGALGPERDKVVKDLTPKEKERYKADIRATNILFEDSPGRAVVQNVQGRQNRVQGNNARGAVASKNGGVPNRVGNVNLAQENGVVLDEEQLLFIAGGQDSTFIDDVDEPPVQDLALNTMFMENLSLADPIYDKVGPSYNSDILSEVQDHDNYIDNVGEYHEVCEMQHDVQQNYIVDSDAEYTSNSNIILYEQYVKNNAEQVVRSNVSFVPNDDLMIIINDMHEQVAQCISANEQNKVINESLTAKLAIYEKQAEIYEKRARFELTEREQKIDEQLRIIITNRNIKKESLKKELYSVKMQLNSTINHNKLIKDEVATLKKDFKQKENKYHEDFLNMKALKEKVEDKLFKQDQSLQTVHMLCKPKPFYDEKKKVAIGYKNPLYLTSAIQVQSALYDGHEIVKTNHALAVVHDSEDTLELAEITKMRMIEKNKKPSRQLSVEQIFWSSVPKPISKMTVYLPNTPAKLVPKKYAEIERKNLLIENENLLADCLSNELLYIVMNAVNTVSRFSEMHDAYTVEQARNAELKAEISKLKHKIQKDDHSEMIKRFSNLEVNHLNLQLKYQHLKERFGNNKSQKTQDVPEFDLFFEINKIKEQLLGNYNTIRKLKVQISHMNERHKNATALQEQNERLRAKNEKVKQHYKELYDSIKITRAKTIEKTCSLLTENEKLKDQLKGKMEFVTMNKVTLKVLSPGMYAIDLEPIPPRNRNNGEVHLDYLKYLKESVETLRKIVKEAIIEKPLDNALKSACFYTKRSHELLEYVIGLNSFTEASRSKPRSNTKNNRILPAKSDNKKKVEDHPRNNKPNLKQENHVDSTIRYKRTCVVKYLESVQAPLVKNGVSNVKQVWKATRKLFANVGYQWKPTRKKFTLGEQCHLTRFTKSKVVPLQQPEHVSTSEIMITERFSNTTQKPLTMYKHRNKKEKAISTSIPTTAETQTIDASVIQIVLWYLNPVCSKHMTWNHSRLKNFVKKFIGTVIFRNDHFGAIMGYGDYVIGDSVISRVYYVEGLGHDLFSVLVALYTISIEDMMKSSPICLLSKSSKHKSWLWHRWLNHLIFGTINDLARKDLVSGLPRLKYEKDHLCSAFQLGKSKKYTHKPKYENTIMEVLHTLHMDLCGPMRVQSINGKRYILVIVDDYSRFTWVKFLISKDETSEFVIKFLKQVQVGLNKTNDVVERRNLIIVEVARTMLIFSKALMFLWAEAVATAYYTQNRSLIHTRHNKTPYELVHGKKYDLIILHVFGALSYPINDSEDLGKLKAKADIGIFVGYAPNRKGYRI
ncbi:retrovirus-related pol polyprotein from transposon TNT 1-94 [Tanacetum coccineum]